MKLITFAVPCYNSEAYMRKCVDSLLTGGDDVEIIIVNDGSKDDTIKIANEYKERFPGIVRVIDKENGGHGSGVNAGAANAVGLYYKVVDSDDWVDESALKTLLDTIKKHLAEDDLPDLYVTNFVYTHVQDNTEYVSEYTKNMPAGKMIGWEEVKPFRRTKMLLMHALTYKTEKLRASETILPEHTYYVDDYFCYKPLPFMKKIFYLNVDLYRYFIGRADQSVNINNFVKNYEMQLRVMRCIVDSYYLEEINKMPKGLKRYMWHDLSAFMITTMLFVGAKDTPERRAKLKELWQHIKERDIAMYKKLRHRSYSTLVLWLPWRPRGWLMVQGYKIICKKVKLG
ncbi:MAG: glycosyltransferase family 2 protein [Clostridia bacterium]|nr:glycosyltransferase family 2 protein [Clostridia bacterium]